MSRTILSQEKIRRVVASVVDPEIPVLTIEDLGILRSVVVEDDRVVVTITPTYSGCPAMEQIRDDIRSSLDHLPVSGVIVVVSQSPPWTTDWISADARKTLEDFGIAPPGPHEDVLCPRCRAGSPTMVTRFGSTACKALMACSSCGEPFGWFKAF